jgi:hypothetical protein
VRAYMQRPARRRLHPWGAADVLLQDIWLQLLIFLLSLSQQSGVLISIVLVNQDQGAVHWNVGTRVNQLEKRFCGRKADRQECILLE